MARLVPAMEADVGRPVSPWILAADAEGANDMDFGGFGVVATRVDERLAWPSLAAGCRPGRTIAKLDGSVAHLRASTKSFGRPSGSLASRLSCSRGLQRIGSQSPGGTGTEQTISLWGKDEQSWASWRDWRPSRERDVIVW